MDEIGNPTFERLRNLKFRLSRRLAPKTYWYLMGRLRPARAVTSDKGSVEECLASGRDVVALLDHVVGLSADMVTLHIGSGLGRVELHLAPKVRSCVGVDISRSMVKRATALVRFKNVEFVESSGDTLAAWPDGFFDLIYSFFVFQHLPRAQFQRYLGDARAKLRPGGHLVFQLLIDDDCVHQEPPAAHPYGLRYYRHRDVDAALHAAGFGEVRALGLDGRTLDPTTATNGDVVYCAVADRS